jgi:hypothetical protein
VTTFNRGNVTQIGWAIYHGEKQPKKKLGFLPGYQRGCWFTEGLVVGGGGGRVEGPGKTCTHSGTLLRKAS